MPIYQFLCKCGVQFEGSNPVSKHSNPKPCPDCGEMAARMMPTTVTGHFNHVVDGPGPQNTGIHDLDSHIDRVIGTSANQNLETMLHRSEVKKRMLLNNPGTEGKDLSRNLDGTYRVMKPEERGAHDRVLDFNTKALKMKSAAQKEASGA